MELDATVKSDVDDFYDFVDTIEEYSNAESDMVILVDDIPINEEIVIPTNMFGKTLTITGVKDDVSSRLIRSTLGNLFTVEDGARVIFKNITVDGNAGDFFDDDGGSLIYVLDGGELILGSSAILCNNNASTGGGVYNSGLTVMIGGTISNCFASGVNDNQSYPFYFVGGGGIFNEGELIIDGGSIYDCSTDFYGGGVFNTGMMTFLEGMISHCKADNRNGGGIYNSMGILTIDGGIITACSASCGGGVANEYDSNLEIVVSTGIDTIINSEFIFHNGLIDNCYSYLGGGIYNTGDAYINGGIISDCSAMSGGGIFSECNYFGPPSANRTTVAHLARLFFISGLITKCTTYITSEDGPSFVEGRGSAIYSDGPTHIVNGKMIDNPAYFSYFVVVISRSAAPYATMTLEEFYLMFPVESMRLTKPIYIDYHSVYEYYSSNSSMMSTDRIYLPDVCWNTFTYARNAIEELPVKIVEVREVFTPNVTPGMIIGQWPIPGYIDIPPEGRTINLSIYLSTNSLD